MDGRQQSPASTESLLSKYFITTNLNTKFLAYIPANRDPARITVIEFQSILTEVHRREFPAHEALSCQELAVLDGFRVPKNYNLHEAFAGLDRRIFATFSEEISDADDPATRVGERLYPPNARGQTKTPGAPAQRNPEHVGLGSAPLTVGPRVKPQGPGAVRESDGAPKGRTTRMQSLVTDKPPELVKERNLRPKRKLEDGVTALDTGSKRQKASVRPQTEPPNHDKREDGIPGSRARRGVAGAQEPAADVASKHTDEAVSLTTAAQVEGSLAGTVLTLRGAPAIVSPGTSKVLEGSRPKPVKESLPGRAKKQKVLAGETDPAAVPDTVSGAKPGSLPDERAIKRATRGQRHAPTPVSELPGGADSQTAGKGSLTNKGQPVRQQVRRLAARESLFASGSSGRGAQGRNKVERAAGGETGGESHQAQERVLSRAGQKGSGLTGQKLWASNAGTNASTPPPAAAALESPQQDGVARKRFLRSSGARQEDVAQSPLPSIDDIRANGTAIVSTRGGKLPQRAPGASEQTLQQPAGAQNAAVVVSKKAGRGRPRKAGAAPPLEPVALEPATPLTNKRKGTGTTSKLDRPALRRRSNGSGEDAAMASTGPAGGLPSPEDWTPSSAPKRQQGPQESKVAAVPRGMAAAASGSVQGVDPPSKASQGPSATTRTSTKAPVKLGHLASSDRSRRQGRSAQPSPQKPSTGGSLPASPASAKRATRKVSIDFRALANVRLRAAAITADEALAKVVRRKDDDDFEDPTCACSKQDKAPLEDHEPAISRAAPSKSARHLHASPRKGGMLGRVVCPVVTASPPQVPGTPRDASLLSRSPDALVQVVAGSDPDERAAHSQLSSHVATKRSNCAASRQETSVQECSVAKQAPAQTPAVQLEEQSGRPMEAPEPTESLDPSCTGSKALAAAEACVADLLRASPAQDDVVHLSNSLPTIPDDVVACDGDVQRMDLARVNASMPTCKSWLQVPDLHTAEDVAAVEAHQQAAQATATFDYHPDWERISGTCNPAVQEVGSFSPDRRTEPGHAGRDRLQGPLEPESGGSEGSTPSPPATLSCPCAPPPRVATPEQLSQPSDSGHPCRLPDGGAAGPGDDVANVSGVAQHSTGLEGPAQALSSGTGSPTRDEGVQHGPAASSPAGGGDSGLEPAKNGSAEAAAWHDLDTPKEDAERGGIGTGSSSSELESGEVASPLGNEAESADPGLETPPSLGEATLPESSEILAKHTAMDNSGGPLATPASPDAIAGVIPDPMSLDKTQKCASHVAQDASCMNKGQQALFQGPLDLHVGGQDQTGLHQSEGPLPDGSPLAHSPVDHAGEDLVEAAEFGPHRPEPAVRLPPLHDDDPLSAGHRPALQHKAADLVQGGPTHVKPDISRSFKGKAERASLWRIGLSPQQTEEVLLHRAVHGSRTARRRSRLRLAALTAEKGCLATTKAVRKRKAGSVAAKKKLATLTDTGRAMQRASQPTHSAGQHVAGEAEGGALCVQSRGRTRNVSLLASQRTGPEGPPEFPLGPDELSPEASGSPMQHVRTHEESRQAHEVGPYSSERVRGTLAFSGGKVPADIACSQGGQTGIAEFEGLPLPVVPSSPPVQQGPSAMQAGSEHVGPSAACGKPYEDGPASNIGGEEVTVEEAQGHTSASLENSVAEGDHPSVAPALPQLPETGSPSTTQRLGKDEGRPGLPSSSWDAAGSATSGSTTSGSTTSESDAHAELTQEKDSAVPVGEPEKPLGDSCGEETVAAESSSPHCSEGNLGVSPLNAREEKPDEAGNLWQDLFPAPESAGPAVQQRGEDGKQAGLKHDGVTSAMDSAHGEELVGQESDTSLTESEEESDATTEANQLSFVEDEENVILPMVRAAALEQQSVRQDALHPTLGMLDDPSSLQALLASMLANPPAQAESPHASQGLENAYEEALGAPSSVQPYPEKEAAIPMFPAASQESLPSMADTPSCGGLELKPLGAYGNLATVKKAMKAAVTCFLNMQLRAMGSAPHQQPMRKISQPEWWPYDSWTMGALDKASRSSLTSFYLTLQDVHQSFLMEHARSGKLTYLLHQLRADTRL